jgi:hypothetical protein
MRPVQECIITAIQGFVILFRRSQFSFQGGDPLLELLPMRLDLALKVVDIF